MRSLDRKVLRDLWRLRGQVIAIGLVIASGVAVLIMSLSTLAALRDTTSAYYERYRFAEVFGRVNRAPERLAGRIADIPGVQTVQTRIVQYATLDMPELHTSVESHQRRHHGRSRITLRKYPVWSNFFYDIVQTYE